VSRRIMSSSTASSIPWTWTCGCPCALIDSDQQQQQEHNSNNNNNETKDEPTKRVISFTMVGSLSLSPRYCVIMFFVCCSSLFSFFSPSHYIYFYLFILHFFKLIQYILLNI
jgi:hypothetical protein